MTRTASAVLAILCLAGFAQAQETGDPKLKSIEAINFAPGGVLLIGDGRGAQVVAVQTGDTTAIPWQKAEIADIKAELAGRLGTEAKGIQIIKVAVNPASHTAYFAVRKLDGKQDLILTLDGKGKIREFSLADVKFTRHALPPDKSPITKITDITQAGDRILVAAQANETFASKIYVIGKKEATCVSTETFHVAHNNWETKAPIRTIIPYEQDGKKFLVGAFTCTPIVKYSLEDIKSGGKVKGESIIELGSGNHPLNMFTYEKKGKTYILMNHERFFHKKNPVGPSPYWTVRVDHDLLKETEKINKDALHRVGNKANEPKTDRAVVADDYHGVVHMARLDAERAVVIRTDDKGVLSLAVLPLP